MQLRWYIRYLHSLRNVKNNFFIALNIEQVRCIKLEELPYSVHINASNISITSRQIYNGINLSIWMAAILHHYLHQLGVVLAIHSVVSVLYLLKVYLTHLKPFGAQNIYNLLEVTQREDIRIVFYEDLQELQSEREFIGV